MMNIIDSFRLVLRTMLQKKKRVFLTISGIVIAIFTFTFFIFVSQGLSNAITGQFSSFGLNVLGVQPITATMDGPPEGEGLTDTDIAKIKQVVSGYKYVAPGIFTIPQYEYNREKAEIVTVSYPDEYIDDVFSDINIEIEEGRMLRPGDKGVVVLGAKTAENGFGDDNPVSIGSSIKVKDRNMRVIGIVKERGDLFVDSSIIMPFDDAKIAADQDSYSVIRISFYDGVDLEQMQENIERKLNPNGDEKRVHVTSPQQAIDQFNQILGILTMIISFIAGIALVVGGINVMNTMYSSVIERVNEISVIKAMGGTNHDILILYLIESSILGFLGSIIGFFMAYGLAEMLSSLITSIGYNVPINFDIGLFLGIVLTTSFFAMLFGTYPAIKAAQVVPADNLRDE